MRFAILILLAMFGFAALSGVETMFENVEEVRETAASRYDELDKL